VKLEGEHTFPVSREALWLALLDPTLLERVLPGCEPLQPMDSDPAHPSWKAGLTVAIGPVKGRFQGILALSDLQPPTSYRLKLDGSGPAGFLRGEGGVELVEAQGGTLLRYSMDAQVGGKLAAVGQRLIESSGRVIAKQGLDGLERELKARNVGLVVEAEVAELDGPDQPVAKIPVPAPAAPTQAQFAGQVAKGVWQELPASWRWGIVLAVAVVVGGIAYVIAR
jgi:uncharacterized protein